MPIIVVELKAPDVKKDLLDAFKQNESLKRTFSSLYAFNIFDFLSSHLYMKPKLFTDDDLYTCEIYNETSKTADICNAMLIVHNSGGMIIYQHKEDIERAEKSSRYIRYF